MILISVLLDEGMSDVNCGLSDRNIIGISDVADEDGQEWIVIDLLDFVLQNKDFSSYIPLCIGCTMYSKLKNGKDAMEGIDFWVMSDKKDAIDYALMLRDNHCNDKIEEKIDSYSDPIPECKCHFYKGQNSNYEYTCYHRKSDARYTVTTYNEICEDNMHLVMENDTSKLCSGEPRFIVAPIMFFNSCL